jgi:hypothetical protein
MNGLMLNQIDKKIFNSPGYFEGVIAASNIFIFKNEEDIENSWPYISYFLRNYQYFESRITDNETQIIPIKPFESEEDRQLAKFIMINYFK